MTVLLYSLLILVTICLIALVAFAAALYGAFTKYIDYRREQLAVQEMILMDLGYQAELIKDAVHGPVEEPPLGVALAVGGRSSANPFSSIFDGASFVANPFMQQGPPSYSAQPSTPPAAPRASILNPQRDLAQREEIIAAMERMMQNRGSM